MECSEFLQRFSEYHDGSLDEASAIRFDGHLRGCPSCRRYRQVVEKGGELVRSLDPVDVPEDFRPRLQHRIYHVEDGDALHGAGGSSGVTSATALGMAVLLALVAWSPTLHAPEPEVELQPIAAAPPTERAPRPAASLERPLVLQPVQRVDFGDDRELWARSHELLFQFSSLYQERSSFSMVRRVGID